MERIDEILQELNRISSVSANRLVVEIMSIKDKKYKELKKEMDGLNKNYLLLEKRTSESIKDVNDFKHTNEKLTSEHIELIRQRDNWMIKANANKQ